MDDRPSVEVQAVRRPQRRRTRALVWIAAFAAALVASPGTASADHDCFIAVSTDRDAPFDDDPRRASASPGDTVYLRFPRFRAGPVPLDWLVDGEAAGRRTFVVIVPARVNDPSRPPMGDPEFAFAVTVGPADVGTVTVRLSKGPDRPCPQSPDAASEAIIAVSARPLPNTATVPDGSRDDRPLPALLALVGAATAALAVARRARRVTEAR
jgi:hypothetical protein